jgi:hypothetical protein
MHGEDRFETISTLWVWRSGKPGTSWHFLTIDGQVSAEIRYAALGRTGGFGSIKVEARIGRTVWSTSIFPQRESGGFILPIKAVVRKSERIGEGDMVTVELRL